MNDKNLLHLLKYSPIFLLLALQLWFPGLAYAQGATIVSVSLPDEPIVSGQKFTVDILVEPGDPIAGVQFDLAFDPSVVTIDKVEEGDLLKQSGASTYFNPGEIDNATGNIIGVAGAITTPGDTVSSSGTFATVIVTAGKKGGSCPLNLSKVIVGDKEGKPVPVDVRSSNVNIEEPASPVTPAPAPTPTPTPEPVITPPPTVPEKNTFRVGPVVRLRPLTDEISISQDGLVELFFSNPSLNEVELHADVYISVPSGIHVHGEGFGQASAAGTVYGQFDVPPGTARTININIKADETAAGKTHFVHFSGLYYPDANKDAYNPISLTHPFKVLEPSVRPTEATRRTQGGFLSCSSPETGASAPSGRPLLAGWAPIALCWVGLGGCYGILRWRGKDRRNRK